MKVFIVFVLCVVAACAVIPLAQETLAQYAKECRSELSLDPDFVKNGGEIDDLSTEKRNCYMACLEKKKGLMNEDGTYNMEFILRHITDLEEKAKKKTLFTNIFEKCKAEVGNDHCKLAACVHLRPKSTK